MTRLQKFLTKHKMNNNDVIDLYNDCIWVGVHPTLVVRTMPSNNYFIYETDESIRNKPDARRTGEHNKE